MRKYDLKRLQTPYTSPPDDPDRFARAIGADIPSLRRLEALVFDDLSETSWGVSWWLGYALGEKARIAISDYLVVSCQSVIDNLGEARLHLMELADVDEREDHFMRDVLDVGADGRLRGMKSPPRTCAEDDLWHELGELHVAGALRGLASTLDCLAAVLVGVLALDVKIKKASFSDPKVLKGLDISANPVHVKHAHRIRRAIERAGPDGWIDWALAYRHMLLHRARRFVGKKVEPRGAALWRGDGGIVALARVVRHLAVDPESSDIEALVSNANVPVLGEPANETLEGVFHSTLGACRDIGEVLVDVWKERKANPADLPQPAKQWPDFGGGKRAFRGYKSNGAPLRIDQINVDPRTVKRLRAAALDGSRSDRWSKFR